MTSLVLAQRQEPMNRADIAAHVQCLTGGMEVLVAPVGSESAANVDRELGRVGLASLHDAGDLIADCGRLATTAPGQMEILRNADRVLAVVRPDVGGLARTRALVERIHEVAEDAEVLLITVGPSSFTPHEVRQIVEVERLESVPLDPRAAAILAGAPGVVRSFARSPLILWARRNIDSIAEPAGDKGAPFDTTQSGPPTEQQTTSVGQTAQRAEDGVRTGAPSSSVNGSNAGTERAHDRRAGSPRQPPR